MMTKGEIITWLKEEDPDRLTELYDLADATRERFAGNAVHLRALIEISNHCERNCLYCGLRKSNKQLKRYRMTLDEIVKTAEKAAENGRKTVVLQSGEDPELTADWVARLVTEIKIKTGVAITLSIGEYSRGDYFRMREAGADRYLLRHETIDYILYEKLHPGKTLTDRVRRLVWLREAGFQIGSGIIAGLPGQTLDSISDDINFMYRLNVDMAGIGPFIPNPDTPLAAATPGDAELALKITALTRLAIPLAHIPATTAIATIIPDGATRALKSGANVLMPNYTPSQYRALYNIYPNRTPIKDDSDSSADGSENAEHLINSIGRTISADYGHSLRKA